MKTQMKLYILFFTLTALALSCHSVILFKEAEQDDYCIYSEFLEYFPHLMPEKQFKTFVISQGTGVGHLKIGDEHHGLLKRVLPLVPVLQESTLEDFKQKNSTTTILEPKRMNKHNIVIITKEERESIFREGPVGWDEFYERYKGSQGILTFSKVGYSKDRKQALLSYDNGCGGKCGHGGVVVLHYVNRAWKIVVIFPMWVR